MACGRWGWRPSRSPDRRWGGHPAVGSTRPSGPRCLRPGPESLRRPARPRSPPIVRATRRATAAGPIRALRRIAPRLPTTKAASSTPAWPLLPVDAAQVAYLEQRLLDAAPGELPVLRDALEPHQSRLTPKLWSVLECGQAGRPPPAAIRRRPGALRPREPPLGRPRRQGGPGTGDGEFPRPRALARSPAAGAWPADDSAGGDLPGQGPLRDRTLAGDRHPRRLRPATIPTCWPSCSWMPTPRRIRASSRSPSGRRRRSCPCSRPSSPREPTPPGTTRRSIRPGRSPTPPWWTGSNRPRAWSPSGSPSARRCRWTNSWTVAEGLRKSGYRPVRFRPYADGPAVVKVAAVWTRDGGSGGWRPG